MGIATDNQETTSQSATSQQTPGVQQWRRLGEVEIAACDEHDLSNTAELTEQTLEALRNAFAPILTSEGMLTALEGAVLDALARKWANGGVPCRLIISTLNANQSEAEPAYPTSWSFFLIERPPAPAAPTVEIVELRLYHE